MIFSIEPKAHVILSCNILIKDSFYRTKHCDSSDFSYVEFYSENRYQKGLSNFFPTFQLRYKSGKAKQSCRMSKKLNDFDKNLLNLWKCKAGDRSKKVA